LAPPRNTQNSEGFGVSFGKHIVAISSAQTEKSQSAKGFRRKFVRVDRRLVCSDGLQEAEGNTE
jgi:hypothetical protein